jgi:hypothetical protein
VNKPIKEGREILRRVMAALLVDAFYPYRGAPSITVEQEENWHARQTVSRLLREGSADLESAPVAQAVDTWSAVKDWTAEGTPIVTGEQGGLFECYRVTPEGRQ